MTSASLKPVIGELESLFSTFNKAFFEGKLETPVITVSPDTTKGAYAVEYDPDQFNSIKITEVFDAEN